jgi:hypothetical protein
MKDMRFNKLFPAGFLIIALLAVLTISIVSLNAQRSSPTPQQFVKQFYVDFYPQYLKYMSSKDRSLSDYKKLFERKKYFSSRLSSCLIENERRQLAAKGRIAGLDFDPFIDAQDDVGSPIVGENKKVNNKYFVLVNFSMCPNHQVVVELASGPEGIVISNFIYPDEKTDLIRISSALK